MNLILVCNYYCLVCTQCMLRSDYLQSSRAVFSWIMISLVLEQTWIQDDHHTFLKVIHKFQDLGCWSYSWERRARLKAEIVRTINSIFILHFCLSVEVLYLLFRFGTCFLRRLVWVGTSFIIFDSHYFLLQYFTTTLITIRVFVFISSLRLGDRNLPRAVVIPWT